MFVFEDFVDDHPAIFFAGILPLCCVLLVAGIAAGANHANFPGERAAMESVRLAVAASIPGQNEDVIGQAVEWNQTLAQYQTYNRIWWAGWAVPNGWMKVEPIPVTSVK